MAYRLLITLAALAVVGHPGWGADAEKKKKKKAGAEPAKATPTVKWEYKVVRGDELEGTKDDALNKLGAEGWELVGINAPEPTPANDRGRDRGASTGGPPNVDEIWRMLTRGENTDKIDLNQRTDIRDRMTQRGTKLPEGGILTKQKFKEDIEQRMALAQTQPRPFSPLTTFYFKRPKVDSPASSARPAAAPDLFFSTTVGTERVFRIGGGEKKDVVTAVEKRGDAWVVTVADPDRDETRVVSVAADKLQILRHGRSAFDEPQVVLLPKAGADETWPLTSDGGSRVHRLVPGVDVEVPAGTFRAVRVDYGRPTAAGFEVAGSIWYVAGIGSVRHVEGGAEVLALKAFKPGPGGR